MKQKVKFEITIFSEFDEISEELEIYKKSSDLDYMNEINSKLYHMVADFEESNYFETDEKEIFDEFLTITIHKIYE